MGKWGGRREAVPSTSCCISRPSAAPPSYQPPQPPPSTQQPTPAAPSTHNLLAHPDTHPATPHAPYLLRKLLGVLRERREAAGAVVVARLLQALLPQLVHQQLHCRHRVVGGWGEGWAQGGTAARSGGGRVSGNWGSEEDLGGLAGLHRLLNLFFCPTQPSPTQHHRNHARRPPHSP